MAIIGIIKFNSQTRWGASESFTLHTATDLDDALLKLETLAKSRVMLLGQGVTCVELSVSDTTVSGDSRVKQGIKPLIKNPPGYNKDLGNIDPQRGFYSDGAFTCLSLRCESPDAQARCTKYLSFLPDVVTDFRDFTITDETWLGYFNQYVELLTSGPYGFLSLDRTNANPVKKITGITASNDAKSTIQIKSVAHGLVDGDKIRIYKNKFKETDNTNINKIWQIVKVSDDAFLLLGSQGVNDPLIFGEWRKRVFRSVQIKKVQPRFLGNRHRGSTFFGGSVRRHKKK